MILMMYNTLQITKEKIVGPEMYSSFDYLGREEKTRYLYWTQNQQFSQIQLYVTTLKVGLIILPRYVMKSRFFVHAWHH